MKYTLEDIKRTLKEEDAFSTVFFVDPIAIRLLYLIANYTRLTPNQISLFAFILGVLGGVFMFLGLFFYGFIFYYLSFLFDCIDGKLARLKGISSKLGQFYDGITLTGYYVLYGFTLHLIINNLYTVILILIVTLGMIILQLNSITIHLKSLYYGDKSNILANEIKNIKNDNKANTRSVIKLYNLISKIKIGRAYLLPTGIDFEFFTIFSIGLLSFIKNMSYIVIGILLLWIIYSFTGLIIGFLFSKEKLGKEQNIH